MRKYKFCLFQNFTVSVAELWCNKCFLALADHIGVPVIGYWHAVWVNLIIFIIKVWCFDTWIKKLKYLFYQFLSSNFTNRPDSSEVSFHGSSRPPSYVPELNTAFSDQMDFAQRSANFWMRVITWCYERIMMSFFDGVIRVIIDKFNTNNISLLNLKCLF